MSTPGLARPRWPAPARQEDRTAADLQVLEERLNQRIATIAAADLWALALVLGRCSGGSWRGWMRRLGTSG